MSKFTNTIQNVFSLLLQDTINLIHYWDYNKKNGNPQAEELLKTGYVKIDNFLPKSQCEDLYNQIKNLTKQYPKSILLENKTFISYRNENTENGPDKGMIDIYNIDRTIKINLDLKKIEEIIKPTTTCDIYFTTIHAYVNQGVEGTRIFHVDNCQPVVYKAFIYLTDVESTDNGPYAFIENTQRFSFSVYKNLFRNFFIKKYRSTDMPVYNKSKEIIALGDKGSLIISNQNGIHRGYPQKKGKERVALVLNYMLVSKLNYLHDTAKSTLKESLNKF